MAPSPENFRQEIAVRARNRKARRFEFSQEEPVVWKPTEVINPECGIPFTDISAWSFIAEKVENGCEIRIVALTKPPDALGYEIVLPGAIGQPNIYIKVQLKGGYILGRSFHNSTR